MPHAAEARQPSTLRALGVARGRLLATALLFGLGAFALATGLDASMVQAATAAATTVVAMLAVTSLIAAGLHRTVTVPVTMCTRLLAELRNGGAVGRLPEAGAPLLLDLVRSLNATSQAVGQRDRSCNLAQQSASAACADDQLALQSMPCAVVVVDARGAVRFANRAAREWFALGKAGPDQAQLRSALPGKAGDALTSALSQFDANHEVSSRRIEFEHGKRHFELRLAALRPDGGTGANGVVAVFTDTTRAHTAAAAEHDLIDALSRELREPLSNLCNSSTVLAGMPAESGAQWREFAGALRTEGERLKSLVDDLWRVEQLRRGTCKLQFAAHDAGNLAADALRLAEPRFARNGMRFELRASGPVPIHCDGPRFVDVLVRLLDDACARGHSGGLVQVLVQTLGERIEVAIADDQPGMRVVLNKPVAPTGTATDHKLGMAICRGTIEAMGGTLHREDSPFGGLQVRVVLPALASIVR